MKSITDTELRFLNPGDWVQLFPSVSQLFTDVFGKERTESRWYWKYLQNPHGEPVVLVAIHRNSIVGFYGLTPRWMIMDSEKFMSYQEVDVMIHPSFTSGGLFKKMGERIYQRLMEGEACFTFGFPNQTSLPAGRRILKWRAIGHIPLWTLYLDPLSAILKRLFSGRSISTPSRYISKALAAWMGDRDLQIRIVREVDARWSDLTRLAAGPAVFHGNRDVVYLNWRYRSDEYIMCEASDSSGITGAAVIAYPSGTDESYLAELLAEPADLRTMQALIAFAIRDAIRRGRSMIRTWAMDDSPLSRILKRSSFIGRDSQLFHVIRSFRNAEFNRILWDPLKWYISAGDSDCI